MIGFPEMPERLLVSVGRAFDEFSLAGSHSFPPSIAIVHRKEGKRFRTCMSIFYQEHFKTGVLQEKWFV
jgi:hypothetical protein